MEKICVLGAGTYGSYLANALSEKFSEAQIKLLDVGDSTTRSEEKAGFLSTVKEGIYSAVNKGRFFGLGGTSARWAGQLLFFSKNDCPGEEAMDDIKRANILYKNNVLRRFFKRVPDLQDYEIQDGLLFRQGVWLNYNKRNFFKHFKIRSIKNVEVVKGARVVKLNIKNRQLASVAIKIGTKLDDVEADRFYLTCGAFESMRLLSVSGLYDLEKITSGFRDRVSFPGFKVLERKARLLKEDFCHRLVGNSLLISRLIGQAAGLTFYLKAVFNEDFTLMKELKNLITRKNPILIRKIITSLKQAYLLFPLLFNYLYHKKLYIYKSWNIYIDVELQESTNRVALSQDNDKFNEQGLDIYFNIPKTTIESFREAKSIIKGLLVKNNLRFHELPEEDCFANSFDTLHPFNLYNSHPEISFREIFNPVNGLFVFHTGILKRICGINPTASLLCLIEKHIAEDF